ncbi:MAG: 2TM domain-containing protein [Actinobacteria bacterium]|nr:2TM domain-containing protein [Actinomycetota bacterium]
MEQDQRPDQATMGNDVREKAEKRVSERIALLSHLGSFVIINAFLVLIWALTGRGYPWFIWVMVGWGVGLAMHAFAYFTGRRGEAMKERMLRKEMEKIRKEQG